MTEISSVKFLELLSGYGIAVNWEDYQIYEAEGERTRRKFYEDRGCVTVVSEYVWAGRKTVDIVIYELSQSAEVNHVIAYWVDKSCGIEAREDKPSVKITANVVFDDVFPDDWADLNTKLSFSRTGERFDIKGHIRQMTDADNNALKAVCDLSMRDDEPDALDLARHFSNLKVSDCDKMLGMFKDGELVGFVEYTYIEALKLAVLENVFVLRNHRTEGIGKALVKAALNDYPTEKWAYDVWKRNKGSIALASSLGFKLAGAMIIIK